MSIDDLPRLMADAMHGDRPEMAKDRAEAEGDIRVKLGKMVAAGRPQTLDPLTLEEQVRLRLEEHARLKADALLCGGVLEPSPEKARDPGALLADIGIEMRLIESIAGPRYWTIGNAARSIATQEKLDEAATNSLLDKMMRAAAEGELEVLDPYWEQPCRADPPRDWYYRTTLGRVNHWLGECEADYRWGTPLDFPVAKSLERWFKTRFEKLPEGIRVTLASKTTLDEWDCPTGLPEEECESWRRAWAARYDASHDPVHDADREAGWEMQGRLQELENEERALRLMRVVEPLQHQSRKRQLAEIAEERKVLDAKLVDACRGVRPAAPVAVPTALVAAGPVPAPSLPSWKARVQAEATEHWIRLLAVGAQPSIHSIAEPMHIWCVTNNVRTKTGVQPRTRYLREHVISGKHWTPPQLTREQAKRHIAQVAQVAQVAQAATAQAPKK